MEESAAAQGHAKFSPNIKKWLGVRGPGSLTSSLTRVSGRLLTIHSTSHITVLNTSSENTSEGLMTAHKSLRTVRTILSQNPPKWGGRGGLNVHLMPFLWDPPTKAQHSSLPNSFLRSATAPTKLMPLSLLNYLCKGSLKYRSKGN